MLTLRWNCNFDVWCLVSERMLINTGTTLRRWRLRGPPDHSTFRQLFLFASGGVCTCSESVCLLFCSVCVVHCVYVVLCSLPASSNRTELKRIELN